MGPYDASFYRDGSRIALSSAEVVVPWIMAKMAPRSVVDIGCGTGEWLSVFHRCGVREIMGIDGAWVPPDQLRIPRSVFVENDLRRPIRPPRPFDLALCLEVAEHLPAAEAAGFIQNLVSFAPVILFSAAIPFQGGKGHENEQWPEYWAALFEQYRYRSIDCVRAHVWSNPAVAYWYSQNCFIAVRDDHLRSCPFLNDAYTRQGQEVPPLVHPMNYFLKVKALYEVRRRPRPLETEANP